MRGLCGVIASGKREQDTTQISTYVVALALALSELGEHFGSTARTITAIKTRSLFRIAPLDGNG